MNVEEQTGRMADQKDQNEAHEYDSHVIFFLIPNQKSPLVCSVSFKYSKLEYHLDSLTETVEGGAGGLASFGL